MSVARTRKGSHRSRPADPAGKNVATDARGGEQRRRLFWRRARPVAAGPAVPGRFGWDLPGGGVTAIVDSPPEVRGPSVQVAGLYPFSAGGTLPMVGVPLGPHLNGRGVVCADPVSWFAAHLINNPSAFVLGRPALGKSSLVFRILTLLAPKGILPLVLSDVKGEYVELVRDGLNGQVIAPGRGNDYVNPLDRGPLSGALADLPAAVRRAAEADIDARRLNTMVGLCELALLRPLKAHERNVLAAAPTLWESQHPGVVPVMPDILALVRSRPERLAAVANDRGEPKRYFARLEGLLDALIALSGDGEFGDVFARPTTSPLEMHRPAVFDLSAVDGMDMRLQAGLQLVCWSYGSAAVAAAKYLADAGLAPRRTYLMVMDELWRALRAATFMVNRVDEVTRLNRMLNLAQMLITHTMDDLRLATEEATAIAFGFVARSEMVYLGGLAIKEMGNLEQVFGMSVEERNLVTSWSVAGTLNASTGKSDPPPGRGKFLLKVGKDIGTPFSVTLTDAERTAHDTNSNWNDTFASLERSGGLSQLSTHDVDGPSLATTAARAAAEVSVTPVTPGPGPGPR